MCSREIFTKKCRQQQIFDSDLKGAWHYNHVTVTPSAKNFMLYCRLIYMLSILCVRLTIKVKVGIPESFKLGWYPPKKTGSSHLKEDLKNTLRSGYSVGTFVRISGLHRRPLSSILFVFMFSFKVVPIAHLLFAITSRVLSCFICFQA